MKRSAVVLTLGIVMMVAGCTGTPREESAAVAPALVGAWRSSVQFEGGAFAAIRDLEFMYVFNAGGTMTESSNYDGAPPVPPAYGVWKSAGPNQFEARYEFFSTRAPGDFGEIAKGGGWMPAGHGVFTERITLATDGTTFTSTIRYEAFDAAGAPASGGGEAVGKGRRIDF